MHARYIFLLIVNSIYSLSALFDNTNNPNKGTKYSELMPQPTKLTADCNNHFRTAKQVFTDQLENDKEHISMDIKSNIFEPFVYIDNDGEIDTEMCCQYLHAYIGMDLTNQIQTIIKRWSELVFFTVTKMVWASTKDQENSALDAVLDSDEEDGNNALSTQAAALRDDMYDLALNMRRQKQMEKYKREETAKLQLLDQKDISTWLQLTTQQQQQLQLMRFFSTTKTDDSVDIDTALRTCREQCVQMMTLNVSKHISQRIDEWALHILGCAKLALKDLINQWKQILEPPNVTQDIATEVRDLCAAAKLSTRNTLKSHRQRAEHRLTDANSATPTLPTASDAVTSQQNVLPNPVRVLEDIVLKVYDSDIMDLTAVSKNKRIEPDILQQYQNELREWASQLSQPTPWNVKVQTNNSYHDTDTVITTRLISSNKRYTLELHMCTELDEYIRTCHNKMNESKPDPHAAVSMGCAEKPESRILMPVITIFNQTDDMEHNDYE